VKIVIATTSGFHLRHLARELIAVGHDVDYLTYLPSFRIRRDGIPAANASSYFWRLAPWSAAALFRYLPRLQNGAVQAMFSRADEAFAVNLPPCDAFIGLSAMADKCARVARDRFGAKIVIERGNAHVLEQNELLVTGGGAPFPELYVARELASYACADYIALPSSHAVESFVERGFPREKIFKNMYGVDLGRFTPSRRPPGPLKLIYVGGWSFRKGCDVMTEVLRAAPELSLTHVGLPLDMALPDLPNFRSIGYRPHAELVREMARHHILLLPSREDGFGMVLIEALASGLPVIGSSKTGAPDLRELIASGKSVAIVPPADPVALRDAIEDMARHVETQGDDRQILSKMDKVNLSWAAYARRYSDFLQSIV